MYPHEKVQYTFGDWPERIVERKREEAALAYLKAAAERSYDEDINTPELNAVLDALAATHKGMVSRYRAALKIQDPEVRSAKLNKIKY